MAEVLLDLKIAALDRQYDRITAATLVQWAREGRILPADQVCVSGTRNWRYVTQVRWLAAYLPAAAPVAPLASPATAPSHQDGGSRHQHGGSGSADPQEISDAELDEEGAGVWVIGKSRRRHEEAEIDMTPMIDVTFQLLIFFMLTNSLANPAPLLVPEAVHGRGISPEGHQLVLIDETGKFYLGHSVEENNAVASLHDLVVEVQQNAKSEQQQLNVIVSAHRAAKYRAVRQLVEELGKVPELGEISLGVEEKR